MATQQNSITALKTLNPSHPTTTVFVENVRVASRRHIPRGCRTDYVQGLTDESKNLYEAYKQQYSSNPFDDRTMESGKPATRQNDRREEENMGGSHHIDKHDSQ